MFLPNKYINLKDSMLYQASLVLFKIIKDKKLTLDLIWKKYNEINNEYSYIYFIYLIEFMYTSNMISYNDKGEIYNENIKFDN